MLDDELSVWLTFLFFSVGKVASVVLETLDGELLFVRDLQEADPLLDVSQTATNTFLSPCPATRTRFLTAVLQDCRPNMSSQTLSRLPGLPPTRHRLSLTRS